MHDNQFPEQLGGDVRIVVVTRDYSSMTNADMWNLRDSVHCGCHRWKLCYVAATSVTDPHRGPNHWQGIVHCRHSSDAHSAWWEVERKGKLPKAYPFSNIDFSNSAWDVAVYVLQDTYITTTIKQSLLSSCGGQHRVLCKEHNYPLISATKDDGMKCVCHSGDLRMVGDPLHEPEQRCGNNALYKCAAPNCNSCICKKHHIRVVDWNGKYFVGEQCGYGDISIPWNDLFDEADEPHFGVADGFVDGFCDDPGAVLDPDEPDHLNAYNRDNDAADDEMFEAHFRLMDYDSERLFVTENRAGFDSLADYTDHIELDEEGNLTRQDPTLPSTDAGTMPIYTYVDPRCDYSSSTVSNHVLLNNFGHMLIRRNHRLTGTSNQKHFLQKLVSSSPGDSLPLLYPEGMLFADVFNMETNDSDVIGAIPSSFLNTDRVLQDFGFAGLEDHYRTRLSNPGILTSSNPKYHLFAFDCLANLALRGCDSRVVLRRGFAEMQDSGGVRFKDASEERILNTEQVDSSNIVNKLAAAVNERPPTYFYTHTCSMKTHFGMKIVWDWLTSSAAVDTLCEGHESAEEREALQKNFIEGNGVLLLRCWMEMIHIWINYITKSPEQPIGEVDQFLFRMELQDAKANLPHLHSLLWTTDDLNTADGLQRALDRIRGFILDIMRPEERQRYVEMGLFDDDEAITRFLSMVQTFLTHHHSRRCFFHQKRKTPDSGFENEGETEVVFRCKANDNAKDNPSRSQHSFVDLPIQHSDDAIAVMVALGLGSVTKDGVFTASEKCLQAIKHYPPAHANEGIISPVFAGLLPLNPNMGNVQFATGYTLSRYLAKYIVMIDNYNTIKITPPKTNSSDGNTFEVDGRELPNQKITGNRMQHTKREKSEQGSCKMKNKRQGRGFNVVEFYMMLFGYDPIYTNIEFSKVTTKPYDERAGRDRTKPVDRIARQQPLQEVALTPLNCIPSHIVRRSKQLPQWRNFLDTQIQIIFDDMQCPLTTSSVTIFGGRPPELMFVARQPDYHRWFVHERPTTGNIEDLTETLMDVITEDPGKSEWIDGFNSCIKVRAAAVLSVLECLEHRACSWFHGYDNMLALFRRIADSLDSFPVLTESQRTVLDLFVTDIGVPRLPVIWFNSVRPTRTVNFFIHILLSMGHVRDEYDLFGSGNMRMSFVRAGLLDPEQPQRSAKRLIRDYVTQQLACLPAGTPTFDRYLVAAYHSIMDLFVHNEIHIDDLPPALYSRNAELTEDKIRNHEYNKKLQLVRHIRSKLTDCGIDNLPTEQECLAATFRNVCTWDPLSVPRGTDQPEESFAEQQEVLSLGKEIIQRYKAAPTHYVKGICHVGAGGVGKTTVLFMHLLYSICQGLKTGITAINSERAQELAGSHIHDLFCMPGHGNLTPGQMAERASSGLYRNPEKLEYIRTMDVLGLDEAGAIPCEINAAMCQILRYIRDNNISYGGLLIMATMDHLQLEPVSGRHPLMSPVFTSCFHFRELVHSVRAALDAPWRRLQQITRLPASVLVQQATRREFITLFVRTCSFVSSLDDRSIPPNIVFVFGKNAPIRQQEHRVLQNVENSARPFRIATAIDEERTIDGDYHQASEVTSRNLDRDLKEPRRLVLYERGRYQLTYNKHNNFSNSQLAILFHLPTQEHVDSKKPLTLLVAPPGCRFIPDDTVSREDLVAVGWKDRQISMAPVQNVVNTEGSTRSRRYQYGLKLHVGSTIHGVMGQTLLSLITRIERGKRSHPYALWLASQVVVLLSRTRLGCNTYFWLPNGATPEETGEAIYDTLLITSPFRDYLKHVLTQLIGQTTDHTHNQYVIDHSRGIFCPKDIAIPTHEHGYVYLLVSTKDLRTVYIGSTKNLSQRWRQHNSGFGANQTRSIHLRPWAILAYITGFEGDESQYRHVENQWILAKEQLLADRRINVTVHNIHNKGKDVVAVYNSQHHTQPLRFISCGTIERADIHSNAGHVGGSFTGPPT